MGKNIIKELPEESANRKGTLLIEVSIVNL
jgi:hypothetical protein